VPSPSIAAAYVARHDVAGRVAGGGDVVFPRALGSGCRTVFVPSGGWVTAASGSAAALRTAIIAETRYGISDVVGFMSALPGRRAVKSTSMLSGAGVSARNCSTFGVRG